jgi:PII-like signaling protein
MAIPLLNGQAVLLRIFVGESDRWQTKALYEALVMEARKAGLAGATVIKGVLSYGVHKHFHSLKLLDLSADLPVIVEMVDTEAKIQDFLNTVDAMLGSCGCLVTLETIRVYKHQPHPESKSL